MQFRNKNRSQKTTLRLAAIDAGYEYLNFFRSEMEKF
jgi:hypothetical protein